MAFGQKMKTVKNLKDSLKKGGGGHPDVVFITEGTMTVRFLSEPTEWVNYDSMYDQATKQSWPAPPDEDMDGSRSNNPGIRPASRYMAHCVVLDDGQKGASKKQDRSVVIQLPKSLVTGLTTRYEKYGTLTDRAFDITRSGKGMNDTEYLYDPLDKEKFNASKFELLDIEEILESMYSAVWSDGEDSDEEDEPKPGSKPRAVAGSSKRRHVKELEEEPEEEPEEDDDLEALGEAGDEGDEDAQARLTELAEEAGLDPDDYSTWAELAAELAPAEDEDEEEEPEEPEEESGDGDDFYTEEELREMPIGELRAVAKSNEINPRGMTKDDIISALLGGDED